MVFIVYEDFKAQKISFHLFSPSYIITTQFTVTEKFKFIIWNNNFIEERLNYSLTFYLTLSNNKNVDKTNKKMFVIYFFLLTARAQAIYISLQLYIYATTYMLKE